MEKRKRGRPPGPTARGEATRERLYETAITAFAARGYEATTLRHIAREAGVSVGLLYRYFPSKPAIVVALYERLSSQFATYQAPEAHLALRLTATLRASLDTLRPHREVLRSTLGVLLADEEAGLLASTTRESRHRVRDRFVEAVTGALDAPNAEDATRIGRLGYWLQMGVLLFWILDRSADARASEALVAWLEAALRAAAAVWWVPGVSPALRSLDALLTAGLLAGED